MRAYDSYAPLPPPTTKRKRNCDVPIRKRHRGRRELYKLEILSLVPTQQAYKVAKSLSISPTCKIDLSLTLRSYFHIQELSIFSNLKLLWDECSYWYKKIGPQKSLIG